MDRSVRTARNAVVNLVAFLYPAILAIVVTPLFVHHVGTRAYGVYALSVAFISILGLLEFGAGIALMKFMPEPIARGDDESANEIMGAGVAFYGLLGLVGALISTIVGVFFVHSLFGVSGELTGQAQRAFVLGGIAFGLTVLMNVAGSVLGSLQDFAAATKVTLAVTTVSTGVAVTLVLLGAGLDGVMIGIVLQPALGMTFFAYAVRRRLPNLRFRPRWSSQIVRRLASLSAYVLIGNVSGLVLFQFDKFYIGIAGGLAAVTFYVVPGTLAGRLHAAGATLTSVSLPAASDLFARGDLWRVHVLYRRAAWLTTLSVGAIAVPAILFSGQLLKHWLGPSFAAHSTHVLEILVATYFVLALSALPYWLAMAAGRPRCTGVFNFATAAINVVAIFALVPSYGIVGAAFAYLISMVTVPGLIWYVERRVLELPASPWPRIVWRLAVGLAVQAAVCFALRGFAHDLAAVIALVLVCVLVAPAVLYVAGLFDAEDKLLLARVFARQAAREAVG